MCIKIPSTWEGLQACRILQSTGTTTLATTLFVIEQAALAGEVGCHYIAPYVNELRVHFDAGYVSPTIPALFINRYPMWKFPLESPNQDLRLDVQSLT